MKLKILLALVIGFAMMGCGNSTNAQTSQTVQNPPQPNVSDEASRPPQAPSI